MKKNNLQKICILGSGGHATSCIDLIESTNKFEIIGIISQKNDKKNNEKFLKKYQIIGSDDDYKKISKFCKNIVIGISFYKDLSLRSKMFKVLKKAGFKLPVVCSPRSHVSLGTKINEGTQIFHNVTINKNVIIGKNCIINSHALIEHDVIIEECSQVSTGAIINGGCVIKKNSFIGSGSILRENIVIKKESFIKMGSIIKK
jgi:sugar O-acyltransferase (sialic acid O-acetyltransferase NeuD family)